MALPLEHLTDDFFGFSERVHVGGVDEITAFFLCIGHDGACVFQRRLVAKHHGAQAQARHFQRAFAQGGEFHVMVSEKKACDAACGLFAWRSKHISHALCLSLSKTDTKKPALLGAGLVGALRLRWIRPSAQTGNHYPRA